MAVRSGVGRRRRGNGIGSGPTIIAALDPGGTSGFASGLWLPSMKKLPLLEQMDALKNGEAVEFVGSERDQAILIYQHLQSLMNDAVAEMIDSGSIGSEGVGMILAVEDFVLRVGKKGSAKREGLAPVRIACLLHGILLKHGAWGTGTSQQISLEPRWQSPSDAMGLITNPRLRRCGRWEIGSEHKRDAWRHVGLALSRYLA